MNIEELQGHLNNCLQQLQKNQIDDDSKLELELLAIQLKRQIRLQVFDPLKNLDNVTLVDTSQLSLLVSQVQTEIGNEQRRVERVQKITSIAKIALKAAGLPIPS